MSSEPADNWNDCRPGDLVGIGRRVRSAQRRRALQLTVLSVGMACVALFAFVNRGDDDDHLISGVTCHEVEAELQQFADHTLTTERQARFAAHIERCPRCQEKLDELQSAPGESQQVSVDAHHDCPHCRLVSLAGP